MVTVRVVLMQVVGDYWEKGIAYFTHSIYMAIGGVVSGGGERLLYKPPFHEGLMHAARPMIGICFDMLFAPPCCCACCCVLLSLHLAEHTYYVHDNLYVHVCMSFSVTHSDKRAVSVFVVKLTRLATLHLTACIHFFHTKVYFKLLLCSSQSGGCSCWICAITAMIMLDCASTAMIMESPVYAEVAPFVGHNAMLRWSAMQEVSFVEDDTRKYWAEDTVSEDFDMSLR